MVGLLRDYPFKSFLENPSEILDGKGYMGASRESLLGKAMAVINVCRADILRNSDEITKIFDRFAVPRIPHVPPLGSLESRRVFSGVSRN